MNIKECDTEVFEYLESLEGKIQMPPLTQENKRRKLELERKSYATVLANADLGYGSYINE